MGKEGQGENRRVLREGRWRNVYRLEMVAAFTLKKILNTGICIATFVYTEPWQTVGRNDVTQVTVLS